MFPCHFRGEHCSASETRTSPVTSEKRALHEQFPNAAKKVFYISLSQYSNSVTYHSGLII